MSVYTEAEHAIALEDTIYWSKHRPGNSKELYEYARYQFRLKDMNEACTFFFKAAEGGEGLAWFWCGRLLKLKLADDEICPRLYTWQECFKNAWIFISGKSKMTKEERYQKAYMLRYGLGTGKDEKLAYSLLLQLQEDFDCYTEEDFVVNTVYTFQGSMSDKNTAPCKSHAGDVLYELAKYSFLGTEPVEKDCLKARRLLKRAYDFHNEEALFLDYAATGKNYEKYEYQNEIRQLYSFRIGQYSRIIDVNPSQKAFLRLIAIYEEGYPGDNELRKREFAQKAGRFRKKMNEM